MLLRFNVTRDIVLGSETRVKADESSKSQGMTGEC